MLLKSEEIYSKFNEENIQIVIPNKLLFTLLQQVDRHREVLSYEEEVLNNFAIHDYISNTEMLMVKLLILMAEPYDKKEVVFETSIAEFLVLRDVVYCNYSLLHLQSKMNSNILELYQKFYEYIESIYEMIDEDEIKVYLDFIKNCKIIDNTIH